LKLLVAAQSGADPLDTTGLDRVDGGEDRPDERSQILHAIGLGSNNDDTEG